MEREKAAALRADPLRGLDVPGAVPVDDVSVSASGGSRYGGPAIAARHCASRRQPLVDDHDLVVEEGV